jgi:Tol biopolymer transport system component
VAEVDLDRASLGKTVLTRPTEAIGAANGMGGGVRFSPDGKRVLFTLPQKQLLIRSLADGSEHTILPQMLGLGRIEWAADGASLLGVGMGKDGKCGFYRVDPASGATALLAACDGENGWFANSAPSPDGKSVYYVVAAGLAAVDLATGTVRSVSTKPVFGFQEMRFSHDGRKLALFQEGGVDILELGAGEVRELIRTAGSYWGGDWSPDDRFLLTTVGYRDSPTELVKLSMDGGAPVKTQLPAHYRGVRLSPDGKTLAMTRWDERRQIWSLENFLPAQSARRE